MPTFGPDLPIIRSEDWEWRLQARCRNADPALFFHPDGERGRQRVERQQRARRVCAECAVSSQCRECSIWFQEAFGIWGGLTEEERSRLLDPPRVHIRTHRPIHSDHSEQEHLQSAQGG